MTVTVTATLSSDRLPVANLRFKLQILIGAAGCQCLRALRLRVASKVATTSDDTVVARFKPAGGRGAAAPAPEVFRRGPRYLGPRFSEAAQAAL